MGDVGRAFEEFLDAFNSHDEARFRAGYADNVVFQSSDGTRLEGVDATVEYGMAWIRAFPDVRLTIVNKVVGGDTVACELEFEGTHEGTLSGPGGDVPATNKRVTGHGAEFFRFEGDKVVEEHLYYDRMELMEQLGLVPEAATA